MICRFNTNQKAKMKIHEMFPSTYLCAADLREREPEVVIDSVTTEKITSETGEINECYLIKFEKAQKAMVLNKTNAKAIATHHGDDSRQWKGKKITLYATTCKAFGEIVPCIRVRAKKGGLK